MVDSLKLDHRKSKPLKRQIAVKQVQNDKLINWACLRKADQ